MRAIVTVKVIADTYGQEVVAHSEIVRTLPEYPAASIATLTEREVGGVRADVHSLILDVERELDAQFAVQGDRAMNREIEATMNPEQDR